MKTTRKFDARAKKMVAAACVDIVNYSNRVREDYVMNHKSIGTENRRVWIPIDMWLGYKHLDVITDETMGPKLMELLRKLGYDFDMRYDTSATPGATRVKTPWTVINPVLTDEDKARFESITAKSHDSIKAIMKQEF